jgi:hypothetical protein
MDSTLPSINPVSKDIPIVSSRGGTEQAYKDPNSPESIIKKTKELEVQAVEDSMFDVNVPADDSKEGFKNRSWFRNNKSRTGIFPRWFIIFIFLVIIIFYNEIQKNNKIIIGALIGITLLYGLSYVISRNKE